MNKKEAIYHTALKLFAERSYHAVGIREIAREADLNSALISYYYGGKPGLLKAIFEEFCSLMILTLARTFNSSSNLPELLKTTSRALLFTARENREVFIIGLRELNREGDGLEDLREELHHVCWSNFTQTLNRFGLEGKEFDTAMEINYGAILGMLFSDYLLGGGGFIDDDQHVETYVSVINHILLNGSESLFR